MSLMERSSHFRDRRRMLLIVALATMTVSGMETVWAAEAVEDPLADTSTRPATMIPIRASGKEFRIQPSARTFASSKEVPLMRGNRFTLQSAVETLEDEKR